MATADDGLVNPATGLRTVFRATAADTDGELLRVDWIGDTGWSTGPDHVHRLQAERFEVLSGRLGVRVDGVEQVLETGDVIVAGAGAPHAAWNAGDDRVHVLVDFRPALRTEIAFEALAGLAQDGKVTGSGAPRNLLQAAVILRHFEDEIYLVRPPLAVQRAILGPLAALGRLLGTAPSTPIPGRAGSRTPRVDSAFSLRQRCRVGTPDDPAPTPDGRRARARPQPHDREQCRGVPRRAATVVPPRASRLTGRRLITARSGCGAARRTGRRTSSRCARAR